MAFIAIQSSVKTWIDRSPRHAPVASAALAVTVVISLAASKLPGDLGPLPLKGVIERWTAPDEVTARAFPRPQARSGLLAELRDVDMLRAAGIFLRDNVSADARIATFWPGAMGYLSRKNTIDLLGRASPPPGSERTLSWYGNPRVDLVAALAQPIDYVIPTLGASAGSLFPDILHVWLDRYDTEGDSPRRMRALVDALRHFEIVSMPVPVSSLDPSIVSESPFILLRNRALEEAPVVRLQVSGNHINVNVSYKGHRQVVDLSLLWTDAEGTAWSMRPTGSWTRDDVNVRSRALLYDTGERPLRLLSGELPKRAERGGLLTARLHSPGMPKNSNFGTVGVPATLRVGRR